MAASFRAVEELAKSFDVEMEILDPGFASRITDHRGRAFRLVRGSVSSNVSIGVRRMRRRRFAV